MKTIILGSSGFIGSHLLKIMSDAIPYDLKEGQDILDTELLAKTMEGCDVVIHLAAFTSVAQCWENPLEVYKNNVLGTANVIKIAQQTKVKRIIFASSSAIYSPVDNPYSASKAMCEGLFQVHKDEMKSICFRFFNVYGKGQNPSYGTAVPAFITGIQEKGEINVYGSGEQTRDFIHVDDVCKVLKQAAEADYKNDFPPFITMDLGTEKPTSVHELAYILMGMIQKSVKVNYLPKRKEAKDSLANIELVQKLYSFQPSISLTEGLKKLVQEGI